MTFWALIILSVLAFGISRRVNARLSLVRYQAARVRGRYAVFAGLFFVMDRLRRDMEHPRFSGTDPLFEYDAVDETARVNLNTAADKGLVFLKGLLMALGVDEWTAEEISLSFMDKKDEFLCPEDLLSLEGVTPEIFERLRPYVTAYPSRGRFQVNLNTATEPVLSALAGSVTGGMTHANRIDAEGFVRKLTAYRAGGDGQEGTEDDVPVVLKEIAFSSPERAIAAALAPMHSARPLYVRAHVEAKDASGIRTVLDAVIGTRALEIVFLNIE